MSSEHGVFSGERKAAARVDGTGGGAPSADEAFGRFVAERYEALCRAAYVLCGDWQHAEDLVQSTLVRVHARRRHVDDFAAYTRTALIHSHASWRRRRWHGECPSDQLPEQSGPDEAEALVRHRALLGALGTLTAEQRAVIALRYLEDLSEAQTAAVIGCSTGTVKSRTSRALTALRQRPELLAIAVEGEADAGR